MEETKHIYQRIQRNLNRHPKPGKERVPNNLRASKGRTCMKVIILLIGINLLLAEVDIIPAILLCMEDQEDLHLVHTILPMHPTNT
mmetsp:Transcript_10481/g.24895  ORF Transcript_10481/g.24895 Transcript_10481/m.24895 type:complete len:86 (+) Transcript_10481:247-504(+)